MDKINHVTNAQAKQLKNVNALFYHIMLIYVKRVHLNVVYLDGEMQSSVKYLNVQLERFIASVELLVLEVVRIY